MESTQILFGVWHCPKQCCIQHQRTLHQHQPFAFLLPRHTSTLAEATTCTQVFIFCVSVNSRVKYLGWRRCGCGRDQIWRKCTGTDPYAFSEWDMPVPAEVSWREPHLRISTLMVICDLPGGKHTNLTWNGGCSWIKGSRFLPSIESFQIAAAACYAS
jgi:hypothetical protein